MSPPGSPVKNFLMLKLSILRHLLLFKKKEKKNVFQGWLPSLWGEGGHISTCWPSLLGLGQLVFNIRIVESITIFFYSFCYSHFLILLPHSKQFQPLPFRER